MAASLASKSPESIQSTTSTEWQDSERALANSSTASEAQEKIRDAIDKAYFTAKELGVTDRVAKLTAPAQDYNGKLETAKQRRISLNLINNRHVEGNLSRTTKLNPANFQRATSSFRATMAKAQSARLLGAKN